MPSGLEQQKDWYATLPIGVSGDCTVLPTSVRLLNESCEVLIKQKIDLVSAQIQKGTTCHEGHLIILISLWPPLQECGLGLAAAASMSKCQFDVASTGMSMLQLNMC